MRYTFRKALVPYAILVVAAAGLMTWYCRAWNLDGRPPVLGEPQNATEADS